MGIITNARHSLYFYAYESIQEHGRVGDISTPIAPVALIDLFYICGALNVILKIAGLNFFYIIDGEFPTVYVMFFYFVLLGIEIYYFRKIDLHLLIEKFNRMKDSGRFSYRISAITYTFLGLTCMGSTFLLP
ncbi:hypothetical protein [Parahaliea aestuarii]|uniref:Uncharacterized protein n=1 Tax=Parahaliea aestuarii TaxID=1852021 RepID=A0A5C8ZKS8_9GAMM|nr:hypothetical protein [Parahaliea aestuarii]TXS89038.1 hypothetical protein FVW59_19120 [Parahaliea aestuarii]